MPDEADIANDKAERDLALSLRERRPELPHTGDCHNCGEAIVDGAFCDPACREDYEARARAARIKGRS